MLTPEQIESNFTKYRTLCQKLHDRSTFALELVDSLSERLALCPASGKKDYHLAEPGGLIKHSLNVLTNLMMICRTFEWEYSKDTLILVALFHDLGKVGTDTEDYYVPAEAWRAEKMGELYTINYKMQFMRVPERSLFLLQQHGIQLSLDETLAIRLHDGMSLEENRVYCMKEPRLAFALSMADYVSTRQEKGEW